MKTVITLLLFCASLAHAQSSMGGKAFAGGNSAKGGGSSGVNTYTFIQSGCVISTPTGASYTLTPTSPFGAGHLIVLGIVDSAVNNYITGVTGGGTWTIPTGSAFQLSDANTGALSWGYTTVSSSASTISISFAASSNYGVCYEELSYTQTPNVTSLGSAVAQNTAATTQPGIATTLASKSTVFQLTVSNNGNPTSITTYTNLQTTTLTAMADLENTTNGTAPTWTYAASSKSLVGALVVQ